MWVFCLQIDTCTGHKIINVLATQWMRTFWGEPACSINNFELIVSPVSAFVRRVVSYTHVCTWSDQKILKFLAILWFLFLTFYLYATKTSWWKLKQKLYHVYMYLYVLEKNDHATRLFVKKTRTESLSLFQYTYSLKQDFEQINISKHLST